MHTNKPNVLQSWWAISLLSPLFYSLYAYRSMLPWDPSPVSGLLVFLCLTPFSMLCALFMGRVVKQKEKGALASALLLLLLLLFGPIRDALAHLPGLSTLLFRYILLLPFSGLLLLSIVWFMRKWQSDGTKALRFSSIYLLVLIAFQIIGIAWAFVHKPVQETKVRAPISLPEKIAAKPDVYFIVFDARTSSDALAKYWQFSDTALVNTMEQYGFNALNGATSNYKHTTLSILSTLNMCYADEVIPMENDEASDEVRGLRAATIPAWFTKMGYQFINLSPFAVCHERAFYNLGNAFSMTVGGYCFYQSFPGRIVSETLLNSWISKFGPFQYWAKLPEQNLRIVDTLLESMQEKQTQPRFVYAHVFMPHAPYAFRHDGRKLGLQEYMSFKKDDKELYLEQLRFANLLMEKLIKQSAKLNAIVILQGDHGFRHLHGPMQQDESFMILNAVKPSPGKQYSFPPALTPVNSFRYILNQEFGAKLPLIKDSIIPE